MRTPPRNLDGRVAAHQIGRARRARGLSRWERRIDIKRFITGEASNEAATRIGKEIAAALRSGLRAGMLDHMHADYDGEIDEIVEHLEHDIHGEAGRGLAGVDALNDILSDLYDWADLNSVWLGP